MRMVEGRPAGKSVEGARLDQIPVRIGSTEEFARVRSFLISVGFDERSVLAALKISSVSQIPTATLTTTDHGSVSAALLAVIDLLVLGNATAADDLQSSCGQDGLAALVALGLIRNAHEFPPLQVFPAGSVVCPVWVYPIDGMFIASDRMTDLANGSAGTITELVFPGHDFGTLQMLRLLPRSTKGEALDVCGGSGIGALYLARNGMLATATDLTHRSAHFAEFNARLNAIPMESLQGNLYTPVAGRRFDVICTHPPWLPSTGDAVAFRDGGDTGEEVTQRAFSGLPHHLRPGGTAIVVSLGRDDQDAHYEHRVRRWLGDAGQDCDVILGIDKILSVDDMMESMRRLYLRNDELRAERIAAHYRELGTTQFVHGAVFVRRTTATVADPPLRLLMSSSATAEDFERIFAWRQRRRQPDFADWLADTKPRLSPKLESNVRYVVRNGALVADTFIFKVRSKLSTALQPDAWMARLLEQIDGNQTVAQIFDSSRGADDWPVDFTLLSLVNFVGKMIEYGLLEIDTGPTTAVPRAIGPLAH
jgi:methylase of polypeptide subunit release factors